MNKPTPADYPYLYLGSLSEARRSNEAGLWRASHQCNICLLYTSLIQEDRQKARQRKERRRINARMQSVPPAPRGLKRWLCRKIMPAYFFYDAVKGRKTVPGVCSACGREISLSGVRYNGNALCPSCGRELIKMCIRDRRPAV